VACTATNGDPKNGHEQLPHIQGNRRDILIGLGGLSAATLGNNPFAFAAPIEAPDLTKCGPADLPTGAKPVNCCPPTSTKIIDFTPPSTSQPLRVRPAAHLVGDDYLAKYKKAIELMKALPSDDPRNFTQQANVHCAYCDGAYHQVGFPNLELQVHSSWLFFPYHRWYLYFNERILRKLLGDDSFALPYWNWDNPPGMYLPSIYTDKSSPLYDALRNANHQPPTLIDLDYGETDDTTGGKGSVDANLAIMYRQMISGATTPGLFFGEKYLAGDEPDPGAGTIESVPHNTVHTWTGDPNQPNIEDMGALYSAGRDPVFFCHHSNVDRMWVIWKTLGGKRKDITNTDWLNAAFLFYDENKNLVRVKVKDCLDTKTLGYVYQDMNLPWKDAKPTARKKKAQKVAQRFGIGAAKAAEASTVQFPLVLESRVNTSVKRPKKSRSKKEKEEQEEVLVIQGIEYDSKDRVKFDVYINEEDETQTRASNSEFAGSYVTVPHAHREKDKKIKTNYKLGLTSLLEDLGAEDDDEVSVTLVPRVGKGLVKIGGIKIDLVAD
jgi:polyphenol oxidase